MVLVDRHVRISLKALSRSPCVPEPRCPVNAVHIPIESPSNRPISTDPASAGQAEGARPDRTKSVIRNPVRFPARIGYW